jgi:hypothetical protein
MRPETYEAILARIKVDPANTDLSDIATCPTCGFQWDDTIVTELTPTPAGRCPNEYNHADPEPETPARRAWTASDIPEGALRRALGEDSNPLEQWENAVLYAHSDEAKAKPLLTVALLIIAGDRLRDDLQEIDDMTGESQ